MSTFVQQLRELLGVPSSFFPTDRAPGASTIRLLSSPTGIAKWELDVLLRQRTYENIMKVKVALFLGLSVGADGKDGT